MNTKTQAAPATDDYEDVRELFQSLDQIHLVCIHPKTERIVGKDFLDNVENAIEYCKAQNSAGLNVYWTVNQVREGVNKKPAKSDIVAARFLHCDIDGPNDGTLDRDAALAQLNGLEFPPSFIINSGNGFGAFWRLEGPHQNFEAIETINAQLGQELGGDHCWNIDRVMRLPNFNNIPNDRKVALGRTVKLASMIQSDNGDVFEAQEIGQSLPPIDMSAKQSADRDSSGLDIDFGNLELLSPEQVGLQTGDRAFEAVMNPDGNDRSDDGLIAVRFLAYENKSDAEIAGLLLNRENKVSDYYLKGSQTQALRFIQRDIRLIRQDCPYIPETRFDEVAFLTNTKSRAVKETGTTESKASADILDLLPSNDNTAIYIYWKTRLNAIIGKHSTEKKAESNFDAAVKGAVEASQPTKSQPVAFWKQNVAPTLPKGIVPKVIEDLAFVQAEQMGVDAGAIALSCLTMCAAVIPDSVKVKVKVHSDWTESARIWTALVGPPSAKKSPIVSLAAGPVKEIEDSYLAEYDEEMQEFGTKTGQEQKASKQPIQRRKRVNNVTTEALQNIAKDNPEGLVVVNDELGQMLGSIDRYTSGKGASADKAFYLESHNGGSYTVDRVGRGNINIRNLSLCIIGGIQPEPMRAIAKDLADDGLIQRFIPVILSKPTMGTDTPQGGEVTAYGDMVRSLQTAFTIREQIAANGVSFDSAVAIPLRFNPEAQKERNRLEAKHFELVMGLEKVSMKLSSHVGKYDGLFARLCVAFHAIENSDISPLPAEISFDTARRVGRFMHEFLMPHARVFYHDILGVSSDHDLVVDLANYILSHHDELEKDGFRLTHRTLMRGPRSLKNLDEQQMDSLFKRMEMGSWINVGPTAKNSSKPSWLVNPDVWTVFADEAEQEKHDLAEIRAVMEANFN